MRKRKILIKLANGANTTPTYSTENSAGADIYSNCCLIVGAHNRALVKTGIFLQLPEDCEAQIRPRSGLALKEGITVLNSPGTIDADYRGEVGVILFNSTDDDFQINYGDRIAQMVIVENVVQADWDISSEVDETERGEKGFGSSGVSEKDAAVPNCYIPSTSKSNKCGNIKCDSRLRCEHFDENAN